MADIYNSFYISGTLKKRLLAKYQEQTSYFALDTLHFDSQYTFSYDGEFATELFSSTDPKMIMKLRTRQEYLIINGANNLKRYALTKYFQMKHINLSFKKVLMPDVENTIDVLIKSDRKFTYALFELLNWIIKDIDAAEFETTLASFIELCNFIFANSKQLNQIDLDFLIYSFKRNTGAYWSMPILKSKEDAYFGITEEHLSSNQTDVIHLGKFVAPNRVKKAVRYLDKTNFTLMAPIYFLTKDDDKASKFLELYENNKDGNTILTTASNAANIPENLREMARRRYLRF